MLKLSEKTEGWRTLAQTQKERVQPLKTTKIAWRCPGIAMDGGKAQNRESGIDRKTLAAEAQAKDREKFPGSPEVSSH